MGFTIFAFLVFFLLIASAGLILFYRQACCNASPPSLRSAANRKRWLGTHSSDRPFALTSVVEQLERVMPKSEADVSIAQQRLTRAGYRNESAVKLFYGAKIVVPITLPCCF